MLVNFGKQQTSLLGEIELKRRNKIMFFRDKYLVGDIKEGFVESNLSFSDSVCYSGLMDLY